MKSFQRLLEPRTPLFYVALLRLLLGVLFIETWLSNLEKDLYTPEGLESFLRFQLNENSLPWYESFILNVIIPIRDVFAPFQLVTELLLGIFLLVGFLTRPMALAGFFFVLNTYLIAIGTGEWLWSYYMILAALALVGVTGAGQVIGVDAYLKARYDNLIQRFLNRSERSETSPNLDSAETA